MEYTLDTIFLSQGQYLWNKNVIDKMFEMFNKFKSTSNNLVNERCFVEFLIEMEQAYRQFLSKIKELPMIMNCRAVGDSNSHFGGQECAELMRSFRLSSEKYLNRTSYKDPALENSLYYVISQIRERAKKSEVIAREIETKLKNEYSSSGTDKTLNFINECGYCSANI